MCCSPHTTYGGNMDLLERAKNLNIKDLKEVILGLGWSTLSIDGQKFDLDVSALGLGKDGKVLSDDWFIFYNQLVSPDQAQSIKHSGDNIDGEGEGDDERIKVDLSSLPEEVDKILLIVTIHEAEERGQSFDQVFDAYVRLLTPDPNFTPDEFYGLFGEDEGLLTLTRFDLTKAASGETAMIFGELYRHNPLFGNSTWKFRARGEGYDDGLRGLARDFGVNVE